MPRGRPRKNKEAIEISNPTKIIEVTEVKIEEENKKDNKDYFAFKYTKNKEGKYEGSYLCCNSKQVMIRLVKNWNKQVDIYGFGPYEKKKKDIVVPNFEDIKEGKYTY